MRNKTVEERRVIHAADDHESVTLEIFDVLRKHMEYYIITQKPLMNISAQKGYTLWFTGLPCAGKTTLANAVARKLRAEGLFVEHLDGDVLRRTISKDLGFSKKDRILHLKRVGRIAAFLSRSGVITLISLISPYRQTRQAVRRTIGNFIEVYVRCPLKVCEKRDIKGMYRLARAGKIRNFTGVSDIYEAPLTPEILVDTQKQTPAACVKKVLRYLKKNR